MTRDADQKRARLAREASDLMRHSADFRRLAPPGDSGDRVVIAVLPEDPMRMVFDKLDEYGTPAMIYTRVEEDERVFWITVEPCSEVASSDDVPIGKDSSVAMLLDLLTLSRQTLHIRPNYDFELAPAEPLLR